MGGDRTVSLARVEQVAVGAESLAEVQWEGWMGPRRESEPWVPLEDYGNRHLDRSAVLSIEVVELSCQF